MSVSVELFRLSNDPQNHRCFHPICTDSSRRSRRATSYEKTFIKLHKQYEHVFRDSTIPMAQYVMPEDVPVNSVAYFHGWFFKNKFYKALYPQYIAFTKKEAERMFREFIDWKNIPMVNDNIITVGMFPETFYEVQDSIKEMLNEFEDGKTFITFTNWFRQ